MLQPIPVGEQVLRLDMVVMLVFALLVLPLALNRRIERIEGGVFLTAYVAYVLFLLL